MQRQTNNDLIIMDVNPESPVSEAYRTLRTNIEFSSVGKEVKVLMITSATREEGKTTTAVNLAVSMAHAGKRVLLIDADLRQSAIHRNLSLPNETGLAHYLALQAELKDVVKSTHISNLDAIVSGGIPPNPAELLTMNRMDHLLEELKEKYDAIILDTPPALTVTDAQIIAAKSDGVILVVQHGKVKRETAKKVKGYLTHVNARLLGVVFNKSGRGQLDSSYAR
jgi:capsular exopolysaccharide synthesis family protein